MPAEHLPRGRQSLFHLGSLGGRQRLLVSLFVTEQGIRQTIGLELLYCSLELHECGVLVVAGVVHDQQEWALTIHVVPLQLIAS